MCNNPNINDDYKPYAAQTFLRLLIYLREVLLQDLAILQSRFEDHPVFKHGVFKGGDWLRFKEEVLHEHSKQLRPAQEASSSRQGAGAVSAELAKVNEKLMEMSERLSVIQDSQEKCHKSSGNDAGTEVKVYVKFNNKDFVSSEPATPPSAHAHNEVPAPVRSSGNLPDIATVSAAPVSHVVMEEKWTWTSVREMDDTAWESVSFKLIGLETVSDIWQEFEFRGDGRCPIALMNARWGDRWRKGQDKSTVVTVSEGTDPVRQTVKAGGTKQRWSRWRAILRCVIALAERKGVKNSTAAGWLHDFCRVVSNHEPKHENDRTKGKPLSFSAIERRCGMWIS